MKRYMPRQHKKRQGCRKKLADQDSPEISGDPEAWDGKPHEKDADEQGNSILPEGSYGFPHTV